MAGGDCSTLSVDAEDIVLRASSYEDWSSIGRCCFQTRTKRENSPKTQIILGIEIQKEKSLVE